MKSRYPSVKKNRHFLDNEKSLHKKFFFNKIFVLLRAPLGRAAYANDAL